MDYKKMHDELDHRHRIDGWGCKENAQTALLEIIIKELSDDQIIRIKEQLEDERKQYDFEPPPFENHSMVVYSKHVVACFLFQQHTE